ncbi:MAG: helix-turn-helix domain-containing protein [Actinomycetota bacterium]
MTALHTDDERGALLDIPAVAELLGVKERFVRRLVEENRVTYHKVGKFVRFYKRDITDWVAEGRVERQR